MTLPLWLACVATTPEPGEEPEEPVPLPDVPAAPADLDVTIDATASATGLLQVELRFRGLEAGDLAFARRGAPEEARITDVRVDDGEGRDVPLNFDGAEIHLSAPHADLVLSYGVEPGGLGRHGHQGMATPTFAVYDGRILFLPRTASPLGTVRLRWELPSGWRVAGPLEPGPDGWAILAPDDPLAREVWLHSLCVGLGPFTEAVTTLGATELRSYVHADLDDAVEQRLVSETEATFRALHERLGFDPGHPIAFVRTPRVDDQPIFGGSSALGACSEADHPTQPDLDATLLSDWLLGDPRDAWFEDGWAGWAEATFGRGLTSDRSRATYQAHLDARIEHPRWPVPLATAPSIRDADQRAYVEDVQAALAARLLDHLLRERGRTTLEEVSRALHEEYGGERRALPLRAEIDRLGRASYADYWAAIADRPGGALAPTWAGYVDDEMRARAAEPPLAWSGELPVSADYLFTLAASGDFARWSELLAFAGSEASRRAQLRAAGITLAHPEVLAAIGGIPPGARYELARAEASWPVELVAPTGPLRPVALRWADDHPDRATVRALVEADLRYEAALGGPLPIASVSMKQGPKDAVAERSAALGLRADQRAQFVARWRSPPAAMVAELLVDGAVRETRPVRLDPRQDEVPFGFFPKDRPIDAEILVFRVSVPGAGTVERWYWQR